jgi:hypothetical protein
MKHLGHVCAFLLFGLALCGCGDKMQGTYSNPTGLAMLDLKTGGKATLTKLGQTASCTYTSDDSQVEVTCGGDKSVFRVNSDGSLTGPGFMGVLKKGK